MMWNDYRHEALSERMKFDDFLAVLYGRLKMGTLSREAQGDFKRTKARMICRAQVRTNPKAGLKVKCD